MWQKLTNLNTSEVCTPKVITETPREIHTQTSLQLFSRTTYTLNYYFLLSHNQVPSTAHHTESQGEPGTPLLIKLLSVRSSVLLPL